MIFRHSREGMIWETLIAGLYDSTPARGGHSHNASRTALLKQQPSLCLMSAGRK